MGRLHSIWAVAVIAASWAVGAHAQTWTFTSCGTIGPTGPDQTACNTAYAGSPSVTVAAGIQTWTVPKSGIYQIVATGARGASANSLEGGEELSHAPSSVQSRLGASANSAGVARKLASSPADNSETHYGGYGAVISGRFTLTTGATLRIAVGQPGSGQASGDNGGGGGGSFVVDASNAPLVIAGGGGGTRNNADQDGCNASTTTFAIEGSGGDSTSSCTVKTTQAGEGGSLSSDDDYGSGGGGFNSNGADDDPPLGQGGASWVNGLAGGNPIQDCGDPGAGGFGGGGSGAGCDGGGGGGGYSGGDGGFIAGGGGSWNAGTSASASIASVDDGSVVITCVSGCTATPTTTVTAPTLGSAMLAALGLMLAAMAAFAQRRSV